MNFTSKQRLIIVLDILRKKTHKEKCVTIKEIIKILKYQYAYDNITRQTIASDILELKELGYDIVEYSKCHNERIFFLENREFDFSEVRIIADAIYSNKFIEPHQKRKIIDKFNSILCEDDIKKLKSTVDCNIVKSKEVDVIKNLSILHDAINEHKVVNFMRGKYTCEKKFQIKSKIYTVEPIHILFENERHYLICMYHKDDGTKVLRNYRIDRIVSVSMSNETFERTEISLERYSIKNFDMFTSKNVDRVILRVNKQLVDSIIEKFGIEAKIRPDYENKDYFILTEDVGINQGLKRWILKQGSNIEVLEPRYFREEIKEEVYKIYAKYKST